MFVSKLVAISAALLLAFGLPLVAGAKEESKIQVPLKVDDSNPGNGKGKGRNDGKLHSTFTEKQATFQVHVKHLVPGGSYELRARDLEETPPADAEVIVDLPADSNGQAKLKIDLLQTGDSMNPPFDPRGKLISIYDTLLEQEVMSSWFYGIPESDTKHTKVKELTELEPAAAGTQGSVRARYDLRPNGKGRLDLQLKKVEPGTYAIYVDGSPVNLNGELDPAELTTNPAGNAKLSLRTPPSKGKAKGKGKGKGHNKKGTLSIDPRRKLIEVKKFNDETPPVEMVVFSGPMLAQIPDLNDCGDGQGADDPIPMERDAAPPTSEGWVTLGIDESCGPIFAVAVDDLLVGDYELSVAGDAVETLKVAVVDGSDSTFGELRFAATPEAGELLLDFALVSGSLVEVRQGDIDQGYTTFFRFTLP
jgi:hypothetical protein